MIGLVVRSLSGVIAVFGALTNEKATMACETEYLYRQAGLHLHNSVTLADQITSIV